MKYICIVIMIVSSLALSAQSGGTIEINDYDRHLRDLRLDLNKTNIINSIQIIFPQI